VCNQKIGVGTADGEPEIYFFHGFNFIKVSYLHLVSSTM
jgi:hypothetical protein